MLVLTEVQRLFQLFALRSTQVGRTLQLLGNYEAATQVFDGAIQQAPRDWDLWHNQGLCHMAAKDYDRYMTSETEFPSNTTATSVLLVQGCKVPATGKWDRAA